MTKFRAACIQTNSAPDIAANLATLEPMIRKVRAEGADLITLPENVATMIKNRDRVFANASPENTHPAVTFFARMAKETKAWILAGSIAVTTDTDRLANRSILFDADGNIAARYDKIHLFDVVLSDTESYRESDNYRGGSQAIVADTPWCKIGMTVCYDLRFPHLHRALAKAGAKILTIPAAFTLTTGKLHWHVLLRARAIETGCFVIAPAQCGLHDGDRRTYGHSLIIAPDGTILTDGGEASGITIAEIDLDKVTQARTMLPCLEHDRPFDLPKN